MESNRSSSSKPWWWKFIQWAIFLMVIIGFAQATRHAINELYAQQAALDQKISELESQITLLPEPSRPPVQEEVRQLQYQRQNYWRVDSLPILIAMLCYAITMTLIGYYWFRTLRYFNQPAPYWPTHRIFMFGQLAKYIPGKAMVFVVRVGMLRPYGVQIVPATVSVFMETLGTIGIAAALSTGFLLLHQPDPKHIWLALLAFVGAVTPTLPPIFNIALRFLLRKKLGAQEQAGIRPLNWSHFLFGWYIIAPALCFAGLSLFFTLKALPATNLGDNWSPFLIIGCIGTACLAAVLGFISFLPGGAGVRELVIMLLLEPLIGGPMALAVAIWFRLVTLGSELLLAASAALIGPTKPGKPISAGKPLTALDSASSAAADSLTSHPH